MTPSKNILQALSNNVKTEPVLYQMNISPTAYLGNNKIFVSHFDLNQIRFDLN